MIQEDPSGRPDAKQAEDRLQEAVSRIDIPALRAQPSTRYRMLSPVASFLVLLAYWRRRLLFTARRVHPIPGRRPDPSRGNRKPPAASTISPDIELAPDSPKDASGLPRPLVAGASTESDTHAARHESQPESPRSLSHAAGVPLPPSASSSTFPGS
jgi:hypothetical protein